MLVVQRVTKRSAGPKRDVLPGDVVIAINDKSVSGLSTLTEQWELVIETMVSNMHPNEQMRIFQWLTEIYVQMTMIKNPKHHILDHNSPKLQHKVLRFHPTLHFLRNGIFEFNELETALDKLFC